MTFLYVDETDEEAQVWGTKLAYQFAYLAAHLIGISSVYPTRAYKTPGLLFGLRAASNDDRAPGGGGVIREGMGIGSPQTVIKNLKMWEEIGVDRMVFIINTAESIPQEKVLRSLRLFAEHVMPALDPDRLGHNGATQRPSPPGNALMPDAGRLTEDLVAHTAPVLSPAYPPPPWKLPGARMLRVLFETDKEPLLDLAAAEAHALVAAVRHHQHRAVPGVAGRAVLARDAVHRLPGRRSSFAPSRCSRSSTAWRRSRRSVRSGECHASYGEVTLSAKKGDKIKGIVSRDGHKLAEVRLEEPERSSRTSCGSTRCFACGSRRRSRRTSATT